MQTDVPGFNTVPFVPSVFAPTFPTIQQQERPLCNFHGHNSLQGIMEPGITKRQRNSTALDNR